MSTDSPSKQGLFSSLNLGRAGRSSKQQSSETLAHPLLGASTSSLSIADPSSSTADGDASLISLSHSRQVSGEASTGGSLPYKPRQKGGGGHGSKGSVSSLQGLTSSHNAGSNPHSTLSTSPTTPTGPTAFPTTSTSTSATFALPSSTIDSSGTADPSSSTGAMANYTATNRLQLQSLKASAQKIGLGNGSMGMALIDTLFDRSLNGKGKEKDNGEWVDLLLMLMTGKAALLLPSASASSLPLTVAVLRDHVAFIGPPLILSQPVLRGERVERPPNSVFVLVTSSGLVGLLQDSTITFESALPGDSRKLSELSNSHVTNSLSDLRPTHLSDPTSYTHFPTFPLSSETALLHFPPPNHSANPSGPDQDTVKSPANKLAKINPFASFFNNSATSLTSPRKNAQEGSPSNLQTPLPEVDLSSSPDGRAVSPINGDASSVRSSDIPDGYRMRGYTVSKVIRHGDLSKSISKSVRNMVKDELSKYPEKTVERITRLILSGVCPSLPVADTKLDDPTTTFDFSDPTALSRAFQDVVEGVYDEVLVQARADSSHIFSDASETGSRLRQKASWSRKSSLTDSSSPFTESEESKKSRREKARQQKEERAEQEATEAAERVEALLSRFLYNRLFSPPEADDSKHDEVLSSRIAALNMLELSLDHLGLVTRPERLSRKEKDRIETSLLQLAELVGAEIQTLSSPTCLTPMDKTDILIRAHKLVVDGLAKLPPIRVRPEGEPYRPPSRGVEDTPVSEPHVSEDATKSASKAIPSRSATIDRPGFLSRASSALSSPLSTSPATSDPLGSIAAVSQAMTPASTNGLPKVVLTESNDAQKLEEAMSDSVLTVAPPDGSTLSPDTHSDNATKDLSLESLGSSGADVILPIIIYAIVKHNPPQLASQLMYLRRYRSAICLTGEASYAIVNLTAVIEFIEHVQFAELGLGDHAGKTINIDNLSPIGLSHLENANEEEASIASASSRLRGRVFQVGELAGSAADSANKVITGVVDSSWSAIRGLISSPVALPSSDGSVPAPATAPETRPRHGSNPAFTIANVTSSVVSMAAAATSRSRASSQASAPAAGVGKEEKVWKGNEELIDVSRPSYLRDEIHDQSHTSEDDHVVQNEESDLPPPVERHQSRRRSDARSIMSVSSVMSREQEARDRAGLTDRIASMGLGRLATADGSGAVSPSKSNARSTPPLSTVTSRLGGPRDQTDLKTVEPGIERFMTCEVGDIRVSEVGLLLRDYRRLAAAIEAINANKQS